jgi:hypothetical protein
MRGKSDRMSHGFVVEKALFPLKDKFNFKQEFIFPGTKGSLYFS